MTTKRKPEEKDEWGLDAGLADDFDITITRARFGYLELYQEGKACLLLWDYESPDTDSEYPIIWPLGKGWSTNRDGTRAEHGKRTRFVETSMLGRLLTRCEELGAMGTLKARGVPRDAKIWEGLSFHMKREKIALPAGASERGLPESIEHLMPVEFLSEGEKQKEEPAPRARQAAKAAVAPDNLIDQLTTLAKSLELAEFQNTAMGIKGLRSADNRALLTEVLEDGPSGFWAKARA